MWARAEEVLPSWRSIALYESSSCWCIYSTLSSSSMCREWHIPSKNKHSESVHCSFSPNPCFVVSNLEACSLNSLSNDGGKKLESSFQVSKHRSRRYATFTWEEEVALILRARDWVIASTSVLTAKVISSQGKTLSLAAVTAISSFPIIESFIVTG